MSDVDTRNLFDILGKLDVSIGNVGSAMEEMRQERSRHLRASMEAAPRFTRILGSTALSSAGFGVVMFDNKPDQGHFWYVRKLVVGGVTPTTVTPGRADVFVGASDMMQVTSLAQVGLANWRDAANSLPMIGDYSNGELVVPSPYELFVIVSGGTSGQQVIVSGDVQTYQEGTAPGRLGF